VAVFRSEEETRNLIAAESLGGLAVANVNSQVQTVVGGTDEALSDLLATGDRLGVGMKRLRVGSQSHTPALAKCAEEFSEAVGAARFGEAYCPVYSNDGGRVLGRWGESLVARLSLAVQWVTEVEGMWNDGVRVFVEVGPGRALSKLVMSILGEREYQVIALSPTGQEEVGELLTGIGEVRKLV